MKKTLRFFALMLGLVSMVMFSSCKKDNEDLIVGKWNVTTISQGSQAMQLSSMGMTMVFEFTKDGKLFEDVTMNFMGETMTDRQEGTYSVDGDKLLMTADGETEEATIQSLDKKELVIFSKMLDEDFGNIEATITMERM